MCVDGQARGAVSIRKRCEMTKQEEDEEEEHEEEKEEEEEDDENTEGYSE